MADERLNHLFEFNQESEVRSFLPINDAVMGGVSLGSMQYAPEGYAVFTGFVSFENNGGFSSVRSNLDGQDFSHATGIRLRVRGDGQDYKLRLSNSASFDGVVYEGRFQSTEGTWKEVDIPFVSLQAKWRGRGVPRAAPFDSSDIASLGFLISDRQQGEFRLEIDWIRTY